MSPTYDGPGAGSGAHGAGNAIAAERCGPNTTGAGRVQVGAVLGTPVAARTVLRADNRNRNGARAARQFGMTAPLDSLTVLTTKGPLATKTIRFRPAGPPEVENYGRAARFSFAVRPFCSFGEFANILKSLEQKPRSFIVRGEPIDGINRQDAPRRLHPEYNPDGSIKIPATLQAAPRRWLGLDFDSIPGPPHIDPLFDPDWVVEYVISLLPVEFHGASFFWAFTSGHGIKPGIRLRIFCLLDRPLEDWVLKIWLKNAPVDAAIFAPTQPIYTAFPLFIGGSDPVPYRSGVWQGDCDFVTAPIIERPAPHLVGWSGGGATGGTGYEYYKGRIDDAADGFNAPIKRAIAAFVAEHGDGADFDWLRTDLAAAIRRANPGAREARYIEQKIRDIDALIAWVLNQEVATEVAAEICDPTYPKPLGSIEDGRRFLDRAIRDIADQIRAWLDRLDDPPKNAEVPTPPVFAIRADAGVGKTRLFCRLVVAPLVDVGYPIVIAVPLHDLGDAIVKRELRTLDIDARVYRGREADDPDNPGKEMCLALDRATAVQSAMGDVARHACRRNADHICPAYEFCGYQKQRNATPQVWLVPHQLLAHPRPKFIPAPALLGIDESFCGALVHTADKPRDNPTKNALRLNDLLEPEHFGRLDKTDAATLRDTSIKTHKAICAAPDGWLSREALVTRGLTAEMMQRAKAIEWKRKIDIEDILPDTPAAGVKAICAEAAGINRAVAHFARLWEMLARTINENYARSPWIEFEKQARAENGETTPAVWLSWRDDIRESWRAPTITMDATTPVEIVRQFFPQLGEPIQVAVAMPHTRVRQITDRPVAKAMLVETEKAGDRRNASRRHNIERLRRLIDVCAGEIGERKMLVVSQQTVENALKQGNLPVNVALTHFNAVAGLNSWEDAWRVVVIGRPEPSPRDVERIARVLFGADIAEIPPDEKGEVRYPRVARGVRMRDGTGRKVEGNGHPDPRAEAVRWAICEGNIVQAAARGRGVNRGPDNPLLIDIITSVCVSIEVDELTTWPAIQPGRGEVMAARGLVPESAADMAALYPDLYRNREVAKKARGEEEELGKTVYKNIIIDEFPQFWAQATYRRAGSRGPAGQALVDLRQFPVDEIRSRLEAALGPLSEFAVEPPDGYVAPVAAEPVVPSGGAANDNPAVPPTAVAARPANQKMRRVRQTRRVRRVRVSKPAGWVPEWDVPF